MMKWMIVLLFAGMLFIAGCPQEDSAPAEMEEEEEETPLPEVEMPQAGPEIIKVGFIGPLTGEQAWRGQEALNSLKLSAAELSDNLHGYEIIEQDGKCTKEGAAEALEYLVDYRGVEIVIGGVCPDEVDGMEPLLGEKGAILLSLSEGTLDNGQVMSFAGATDSIGEALAQFCAQNQLRRTMVVTDGTPDALEAKGLFDAAAKESGLSTQPAQQYGANFASATSIIKGYQPEVVLVLATDSATGAQIVNTLRASGINSAILGDHSLVSAAAISLMGANSEGVYAITSQFDYNEPVAAYFLGRYASSYGAPADSALVGDARNALYLFAQAEDFYNYRATAQDLKNYWMNLAFWEGMGGTLIFENGDRVSSFRSVIVAGGKITPLP